MFTKEEVRFLLELLDSAQIGGNRRAILKAMELMDSIEAKLKAAAEEEEKPAD